MTYNELIDRVSESRDIPKSQAKEIIDSLFETLGQELERGSGVSIPGLGTFRTKTKEERKVYSPHHETYIMVPPKRVVDFTPSANLKENLKFVEAGNE
ncbi:HU family DNA-binding protein [Rhodohalobacter sp. 8-1]|uniref:HU family DNA-binding protein n=1 Tax=Rhodohalobacter sp. 8-1 TaxID=3131972 RepID=UPI0030ED32E3